MKRNEIEFDAEALVGSVEAFAAHVQGKQKLTLRTNQLSLPSPIKPIGPEDITALRQKLNVSQAVFARSAQCAQGDGHQLGERAPAADRRRPPFA